jgi:hypothetical protein
MSFLQYDATGDESFLKLGREKTLKYMASHVSHVGVHDHGFNNVSTYGNLRRLMLEGKTRSNQYELDYTEVALKASGAVQAARHTNVRSSWSPVAGSLGVVPSGTSTRSMARSRSSPIRSARCARSSSRTSSATC